MAGEVNDECHGRGMYVYNIDVRSKNTRPSEGYILAKAYELKPSLRCR
jgi:hypothetical protein